MSVKLTNNATSVLTNNIDTLATGLSLTSGDENRFPTLAAGDWCPIVVADAAGNREIMRCTARSGVNLTVVRAQEGTAARAFTAGARVDVRLTNQAIAEMNADATLLATGLVADAVLPARLRPALLVVPGAPSDCNAVTVSDDYYTTSATINQPPGMTGVQGYLSAEIYDVANTAQYQEWQHVNADTRFARRKISSVWGAWYELATTKAELELPAGVMMDWGGASATVAPAGWYLCYGQVISRSAPNDKLFAAIGTRFNTGGEAGTSFRLPDFRGRVAAGNDMMGGTSANRLTGTIAGSVNGDTVGNAGGEEGHILTDAQMPSHGHSLGTVAIGQGGAHTHTIPHAASGGTPGTYVGNDGSGPNQLTTSQASPSTHSHPLTGALGLAGSDAAHNNVQPTLIVNKIIKY